MPPQEPHLACIALSASCQRSIRFSPAPLSHSHSPLARPHILLIYPYVHSAAQQPVCKIVVPQAEHQLRLCLRSSAALYQLRLPSRACTGVPGLAVAVSREQPMRLLSDGHTSLLSGTHRKEQGVACLRQIALRRAWRRHMWRREGQCHCGLTGARGRGPEMLHQLLWDSIERR